jgi:hypothetical protein
VLGMLPLLAATKTVEELRGKYDAVSGYEGSDDAQEGAFSVEPYLPRL